MASLCRTLRTNCPATASRLGTDHQVDVLDFKSQAKVPEPGFPSECPPSSSWPYIHSKRSMSCFIDVPGRTVDRRLR